MSGKGLLLQLDADTLFVQFPRAGQPQTFQSAGWRVDLGRGPFKKLPCNLLRRVYHQSFLVQDFEQWPLAGS